MILLSRFSFIADLRTAFTLVPWRMRPKLILMVIGSILVALMDMAAVALVLPLMQMVSGTQINASPILQFLSQLSGISEVQHLLVATLVVVITLMTAKNLLTILFRWWSLGVIARAQADATHEVMHLYTSSPWVDHRKRSSDTVLQTLTQYIHTSFSGVTTALISLLTDFVSIVALLTVLTVVSPAATFIAAIFFAGSALVIQRALKNHILTLAERTRIENLKSWNYLTPSIDGFRDIQLANAAPKFAIKFSESRRRIAEWTRTITVLNEIPRYLLEIVMMLGIMVIAIALFATSPQEQAFAFLGVFAVAAIRIIPSLNRMVGTLGLVRANIPNLAGLAEQARLLRAETGRRTQPEEPREFPFEDIQFNDVTFTFPDATAPVLNVVSGAIPAGKTVALTGASGAGKSTFMDILLGLLEPQTGSVFVDGVSIHEHPNSWRAQIGVVSQDVFLMDNTIRANIMLGYDLEEVDESRLNEAIDMAQLRDFIDELPEGLETLVGYRGTRTSGGQRQRIGIARALYRRPQVLFLDEATSALDNETEAQISQTIRDLHGKMTIVVIAHRLSTVKHADSILFFSHGSIVGRGSMEELVSTNQEFAELVRLGRLT